MTARALSAAMLRDLLNELHARDPDNEGWERDVVVRVMDDDSGCAVGGLVHFGFEAGCTEHVALCLDGDPEAYSDEEDEDDEAEALRACEKARLLREGPRG